MEIYLSHMVIFRVIEKLKLTKVLGDGWLQYIATVAAVIVGAAVFAVVFEAVAKKIVEKAAGVRKTGGRNDARREINSR